MTGSGENMKIIIAVSICAGILAGCGGGGGSSSNDPSLTPPAPANSPPSATDSEITIDEDTEYSGAFSFTDPDGDSLTYSVVNDPTNGVIDLDSSGSYTYTPNSDFYGADSVTVRVSDGNDPVDIVLTITVNDVEELTVFKEEAKVIDLSLIHI